MLGSAAVTVSDAGLAHGLIETLADYGAQAGLVEKSSELFKAKGNVMDFEGGDRFLVTHGAGFNKGCK